MQEIRGTGYFYAIELGRSRASGEHLSEEDTNRYVNEVLPHYIRDAGLLIRADNRGRAKLMLSPPLIAQEAELDELAAGVSQVIERFEADLAS